MKVLAVVMIIGSVSAFKSGPYLPSGWRPDGPAFLLPSEPRPPVSVPPQDFILQGSEASGSEFLREYGPPKLQSLPEVDTEKAFVELQARFTDEDNEAKVEKVVVASEVITDLKYEIINDATTTEATEASVSVDETEQSSQTQSEQLARSNLDVEAALEETEAIVDEEQKTDTKETEAVNEKVETEEKSEAVKEKVETEVVKEAVEGVNNIAEAIVNLEKEATQEKQSQDITVKLSRTSESEVQVPEGFLEYGPPGFREYGPPNLAPRNAEDVKSEEEIIENNETRRRRFSPKFKSLKTKKH